ncbi:hypothetical protein HDU96_004080 [Phlyctochytrium bullatum]|nr:hypothetical protein HDU96_004080 [Phlyctochytrium bullatum]
MTTLFIDVYEKELKAADYLGAAVIDLKAESLTEQWMKDMWVPLLNEKHEVTGAEIQLSIFEFVERESSLLYAKFKANVQKRIQKMALEVIDQAGKEAADADVKKASLFRG